MHGDESVMEENFVPAPTDESVNKNSTDDESVPEEEVHELFRVYLSRADIPSAAEANAQIQINSEQTHSHSEVPVQTVCVTQSSYYALVVATTILSSLFAAVILVALFALRRSKFAVTGVSVCAQFA